MTRMLVLLAMTPGVVLASSASSSGPVCAVMSPLLPTALGCSCADAASGVGGTSACPLDIPAVTLVPAVPMISDAIATPAMTFSIGAALLPCGTPASASAHGSITLTLPGGASLPDGMETNINAVDGVSVTVAGSTVTITIEKSVTAGGASTTIDIPIATGIIARINLSLTGNIASLVLTESLDICATTGGTTYCGADIATIPGVGSAAASALLNPPWDLARITASFTNACAAPPPPPPPPPPSPVAATTVGGGGSGDADNTTEAAAAAAPVTTYKVTTTFTLSGSISDYNATAQASIKAVLAAAAVAAGITVNASDISLTLTAGSVIVAAEITAPNQAAATTISTALSNGPLASQAAMQNSLAALGVSTTVSAITPPEVVASSRGGGGGVGAGVIIVIVLLVLLVLSVIAFGVAVKFKKLPLKEKTSSASSASTDGSSSMTV